MEQARRPNQPLRYRTVPQLTNRHIHRNNTQETDRKCSSPNRARAHTHKKGQTVETRLRGLEPAASIGPVSLAGLRVGMHAQACSSHLHTPARSTPRDILAHRAGARGGGHSSTHHGMLLGRAGSAAQGHGRLTRILLRRRRLHGCSGRNCPGLATGHCSGAHASRRLAQPISQNVAIDTEQSQHDQAAHTREGARPRLLAMAMLSRSTVPLRPSRAEAELQLQPQRVPPQRAQRNPCNVYRVTRRARRWMHGRQDVSASPIHPHLSRQASLCFISMRRAMRS
jgi:hypothetical protein